MTPSNERVPGVRRPTLVLAGTLLLLSTARCGYSPVRQALEPATGPVLVVANQEQGRATIIELETGRLVAHVDAGMHPHEGAASPDGRTVALVSPSTWSGDARTVALLDVETATVSRTIDLGWQRWPHGVAFQEDGTLLVASGAGASVLFIDPARGDVIHRSDNGGARPYLLHRSPSTGRIYTSSPSSNVVTELDEGTRRLRRVFRVQDQPAGFAVAPGGSRLWIATSLGESGGQVAILNLTTGLVERWLPGLTHPRRIAFSGDGSRVLVSDWDHVAVYDAARQAEIGRLNLAKGGAASGVVCAPDAPLCYVALMRAGIVAEIHIDRLEVLRRFEVGEGADGLVYVAR
jgi:DNA-binding beta-propeller fold protein YncE